MKTEVLAELEKFAEWAESNSDEPLRLQYLLDAYVFEQEWRLAINEHGASSHFRRNIKSLPEGWRWF